MTPDRLGCVAPRHGDRNAYTSAGCRCPDAREDWRLYSKRRREGRLRTRRVPVTGSRRRLRALLAMGWRVVDIADAMRRDPHTVRQLIWGPRPTVTRATARLVVAVYDRLSMRFGPSVITAARAAVAGYALPLQWDDDSIDDPRAHPIRRPSQRTLVELHERECEELAAMRHRRWAS